jgi:thiamine biosynthesis lipoprotein
MGTRFSLVVPEVDPALGEDLLELARTCIGQHETMLSRFGPQSSLAMINAHAADFPVPVPTGLWSVLRLCREHWQRTSHAFDITLQPLARLWRHLLARGTQPSPEEIAEARARTGFEQVEFDEARQTVRFARPGMSLDLGGVGKGYALDVLARQLVAFGVVNALLSFGESSVTVIGTHPSHRPWPIGIVDPFQLHSVRHTFHLTDGSISTSGTTPRNRSVGDGTWGQIIDPRSACPLQGYRTLSVAASCATEAEVLSTALLVLPAAERVAVLTRYPGACAIEFTYASDGHAAPADPLWRHAC